MDIWQMIEQLEAEARQDLQAMLVLIEIYERLLQEDLDAQKRASIQKRLGTIYKDLPTGDLTANLERAIVCYEAALQFWTPETAPLDYAEIQNYLGTVYNYLLIADPTADWQQAIACFQEALRFWTPEAASLGYAAAQANLGTVYGNLPTGDRTANLQQAIACFQQALRFLTPETDPLNYAAVQTNLGNTYRSLPTEDRTAKDRTANLLQAISCYKEALRFWTPERSPLAYASIQTNLGNAYRDLPAEDRTANLLQAISCYKEALRFGTPETNSFGYAETQTNLGVAYTDLRAGDRAANLQQAIDCFQQALRFWTPETNQLSYALVQNNLGLAHSYLPTGDRNANLQQAIACYQEALRFRTPETNSLDYAITQGNLGIAYSDLPLGDRNANLKQAIACYKEALRFRTPETDSPGYAETQNNLGVAYNDLPTGDRSANLQQAIDCFQEALRFRTPETNSLGYAETQNNLGIVYSHLSTGDRSANLQQAIFYYQEALRFRTPEITPLDYAATQNNLGLTYSDLRAGDRTANLQQAIARYQEALRFWTPETAPLNYAGTQTNLGAAYSQLPAEDKNASVQQAITCYQEALRFQTPEIVPHDCRSSNYSLADLYFTQKQWDTALNTYQAAISAGEQLYRAGLSTESKAIEIATNAALYRHAAFSAVHCGKTADALLILEQGKTRILSEALRLRISRPMYVPDNVWTTYMDAAATVRSLQARVPTFLQQAQDSSQAYAAHVQDAHAATVLLERAIAQVRVHAPDFLRTIDLHVAQSLLPDDATCFVLFCITEQGSMGFLVTRHSPEVQVIEIPTFSQSDLVHLLVQLGDNGEFPGGWLGAYNRYLLIEQTQTARDAWKETITRTLDALGQRLLAPILSALPENIDHLIFLPSAQLFLFPLHAVPLAGNRAERVGDRYQVSYAPSIEVLANTRVRATRDVSPHLYAVINPEADTGLAFTSREGAAITALFAQSTLDEGRTGTKQQVMTRVRGQSYLHFACHGRYDLITPTLSGLDFADGCLTLAELQEGNIDLSATRLVTLSACETGVTDVIQGSAEEYVGVPAGFMLAGVPCVISSLWPVPDLSTALLMERFYSNHLKDEMGFPAALREAQRWVRTLDIGAVVEYAEQCYDQSGRENATLSRWCRHYRSRAKQQADLHPFEHPYYWAAFTVNGW